MKHLNLFALGQANAEDLGELLGWMERIPSGEASLDQMKRNPPIRTSKLSPALKVLEQFGLVSGKQGRFAITVSGEEFAKSGPLARRAVLRALFMRYESVQRVVELLATSVSGRLPKKMVNESFGLASPAVVMEAEIQAFIGWAESCELFGHDKKKDEIFSFERGLPRGPVEKPQPLSSRLALVPKAS